MPAAFSKVSLSVKPKSGGEAEIVAPEVLQSLNYAFVLVKKGAEEGIVRVEAPDADLVKIEGDQNCPKKSCLKKR